MKFNFADQIKQKTNKELTDIFINAKDYNPEFVKLAEEELAARNIPADASKQVRDKNKTVNIHQLQVGKSGSPLYLFLCFILALFGGFIGIYAGYIYSRSKIKDNDGQAYHVYDKQTRELGTIMMWIGIIVLLFFLFRNLF